MTHKPPPVLSVALQSHASGAATVAALKRPVALLNSRYLHGYLHFFLFVDEKISPALESDYTLAGGP